MVISMLRTLGKQSQEVLKTKMEYNSRTKLSMDLILTL